MPSAVGFVVIGRNEGARLELCLKSVLLLSQRVSYADSASTDGSPELAEQLGAAVVRLPQDGKLNAARGRNAGYAELVRRFPECDAIQFLDGDCILQPGYLQLALNFLNGHPRAAVVCGRRFELDPGASIYNALCEQEWNTPVGQAEACGGDALIRRSAFDQVGGYNGEILAGEEPEMTARMRAAGWEIWRIDAAMTEHDARIRTLRQWWRRTQRGGFGYAQVWCLTKALPRRLYGRQLQSSITWAFVIPMVIALAAIITRKPLILLLYPAACGAQILRLGLQSQASLTRWANAALLVLAKFPELLGALRFFLSGQSRAIPEYKVDV